MSVERVRSCVKPLGRLLLLLSLLFPNASATAQPTPRHAPDTILVRFKASALPADQALVHALVGAHAYKSFGIDYTHPDLSANMFRNELDCDSNGIDDDGNGKVDDCFGIDTANNDSNPMDDANPGHGTHVSGTIGAVGNNAVGVVGVNWAVRLMACKFLGATGSGTTADAIDCLEYVKLMKDRGVNIVATSNSWGGGGFSQALFDAIAAQ